MGQPPIDDDFRPSFAAGQKERTSGTTGLGRRLARRQSVTPLAPRKGGKAAAAAARARAWNPGEAKQRVVVKVSYRIHSAQAAIAGSQEPAGNLRQHLRYIQREAAQLDEGRPDLFGPDAEVQPDAASVVQDWRDDRHHYRLIISPENAHKLSDLEGYTRRTLEGLSEKLNRPLEWVAATHNNTDQPHVHVVLRGVADGKNLTLPRQVVSYGVRAIASEVATAELGERTHDQIREHYKAQLRRTGVTELDRIIARVKETQDGVTTVDPRDTRISDDARPHIVGRLMHLKEMGLAQSPKRHVYTVDATFIDTLRKIEERERVHATLRQHVGLESARTRVYTGSGPDEVIDGRVVARGLTQGGRRGYVLVRGEKQLAYAELPPDYTPKLPEGAVVRLYDRGRSAVDPDLKHVVDETGRVADADLAQRQDGGALQRRLQHLERQGGAVKTDSGYGLSPQTHEALRDNQALTRSGPAVRVLSATDPSLQTDAAYWTLTDQHIAKKETPTWSGGADAYRARLETLAKRGLVTIKSDGTHHFVRGATARLKRAERNHHAQQWAAAHNTKATPLAVAKSGAGQVTRAVLVDRLNLAQGRAVVLQHQGGIVVARSGDRSTPIGSPVGVTAGDRGTVQLARQEREAGGPVL